MAIKVILMIEHHSIEKNFGLPLEMRSQDQLFEIYQKMSNCRFNADANTGHGFAIFMASVGALRASRSGAG